MSIRKLLYVVLATSPFIVGCGRAEKEGIRPEPLGQGPQGGSRSSGDCPRGLQGPELSMLATPAGARYCMDRTEVTQSQYALFLAAAEKTDVRGRVTGQHPTCGKDYELIKRSPGPDAPETKCRSSLWLPEERPDDPVVCIDHCAARAYCQWAGKQLCGKPTGGPGEQANIADTEASAWTNACTSGGKANEAVPGGVASGRCNASGYGLPDRASVSADPECHSDVPEFAGILNLGGGVQEWEGVGRDLS